VLRARSGQTLFDTVDGAATVEPRLAVDEQLESPSRWDALNHLQPKSRSTDQLRLFYHEGHEAGPTRTPTVELQ
ncbi:MAG: hypothetical protein WB048_00905, partial [Pseudolabrys sp.]